MSDDDVSRECAQAASVEAPTSRAAALARARALVNGQHVRELLGRVGNHEYARASHTMLRRELSGTFSDMWVVYAGLDSADAARIIAQISELDASSSEIDNDAADWDEMVVRRGNRWP